jgi:hypothetical protein
MAGGKDVADFYEILLAAPGADRPIKLDSKLTGRTALLLVIGLEYGLSGPEIGNPYAKILSEEDRKALQELVGALLEKTVTAGFYEKLKKRLG